MKKAVWVKTFFLILLLAGCSQDPYPKDKVFTPKKPETPPPPVPPLVLDVPSVMEFDEGKLGVYPVHASVPAPGSPVLSVSDLPEGAQFSVGEMKLSWNPPHAPADSTHPASAVRTYAVTFRLTDSRDEVTFIQKKAYLLVHNSPMTVTIDTDQASEMSEGQSFTQRVKINCPDSPKGPFKLFAQGLPTGASIEQDPSDVASFYVRYKPDYRVVTVQDSRDTKGFFHKHDVTFVAYGPTGSEGVQKVGWTIYDDRQTARVSAPTSITAHREASVLVSAVDENGEVRPKISATVPFGSVRVEEQSTSGADANHTATASVVWSDIPDDKVGQSASLTLHTCVAKDYYYDYRLCSDQVVEVNFEATSPTLPRIDRAMWAIGDTRYVRVGAKSNVVLPVSGGSVKLLPSSIQSEVSWHDNALEIAPQSEGMKQFQLSVSSPWGDTVSESFVFEAVPASSPSVLILGDPLASAEPRKTLDLFANARILDPEFESLDGRTLAMTETLVLGTDLLAKPALVTSVAKGFAKVKTVFIHSPLAKTEPLVTLLPQLISDWVGFRGRLGDEGLKPAPALDQLKFVNLSASTSSPIDLPFPDVRLGGKASGESPRPLVLENRNVGSCATILGLKVDGQAEPYSVTTRCRGEYGAGFVVSGFEWSDIAAQKAEDQAAIKKWIAELIKPLR